MGKAAKFTIAEVCDSTKVQKIFLGFKSKGVMGWGGGFWGLGGEGSLLTSIGFEV